MASTSNAERRAAFLLLGRALAEADASVSHGDVRRIEAAVKEVGKAFDDYSNRCREELVQTTSVSPLVGARLAMLRSLTTLLSDLERSISDGDFDSVEAAIEQAREAVELAAEFERASRQSGIRHRFPKG